MLVPFEKTVVIVDALAFRRAGVHNFLEPWAADENVELISLPPGEANAKLVNRNCEMLIYNIGGDACAFSCKIIAEIRLLHTLCPTAALVILADDASHGSIITAMNSEARGYLENSMDPGLALHALSFVLHGGTYFPPAAIMAGQTASVTSDTSVVTSPHPNFSKDTSQGQPPSVAPRQERSSISGHGDSFFQQQDSRFSEQTAWERPADSVAPLRNACANLSIPESQLTERERAVLRCLGRGDSNKVIGRTCRIAESTVKIHMKSILRKIHAKNRTQAAIWAMQNNLCTDSDLPGILAANDPLHNSDLFASDDLFD